ncbi:ABC transporter ATP-binding protein [Ferrovibrio sp.]|uniref:ABC transporter ATP-binding protein n=1 Tax=Ferrovibrio sp. TaxID=1917215 RepID=UPI003516C35E
MSLRPPVFSIRCPGFAYDGLPVLDAFTLDLQPGEIVAILGPSGGGKSTLLKLLAGLLPGCTGPSLTAQTAWMAQQDLLLPWLTVRQNILLGSRLRGESPAQAEADALLARLGLAAHGGSRPATLSGGMRQRVALARTLLENRPLVLMDEPFSALDAVTREAMQDLACSQLAGRAVVLVTHDPAEACRIAHRILLLDGRPARLREILRLPQPVPRDVRSSALLPALRQVHAALQAGSGMEMA